MYITEWYCWLQGLYSIDDRGVCKCGALVDNIDMEKQKYSGNTCPSTILSTINPKWTGLGLKLGHCSDRSANDRIMVWPLKTLLITMPVC